MELQSGRSPIGTKIVLYFVQPLSTANIPTHNIVSKIRTRLGEIKISYGIDHDVTHFLLSEGDRIYVWMEKTKCGRLILKKSAPRSPTFLTRSSVCQGYQCTCAVQMSVPEVWVTRYGPFMNWSESKHFKN